MLTLLLVQMALMLEAITIEDGTLNINAAGDGIKSSEDITITGET